MRPESLSAVVDVEVSADGVRLFRCEGAVGLPSRASCCLLCPEESRNMFFKLNVNNKEAGILPTFTHLPLY